MEQGSAKIVEGTWVRTPTIDGHMVAGFVDLVVDTDSTVYIQVVQSCCGRVGKFAWAYIKDVEVMEESKLTDTEGYVRNAIDFALDTGDKEAFMELTYMLRKLIYASHNPVNVMVITYQAH